jgi:HSP20 family molecular chaperone IbpA
MAEVTGSSPVGSITFPRVDLGPKTSEIPLPRRTGRFEYRVRLPESVDADKIEAKLDGGVLTVAVPKAQRAERRKIELRS